MLAVSILRRYVAQPKFNVYLMRGLRVGWYNIQYLYSAI